MSEVSALALVREKGEVEPRVGRGGEREAIVVLLDWQNSNQRWREGGWSAYAEGIEAAVVLLCDGGWCKSGRYGCRGDEADAMVWFWARARLHD